MLAIFLLPICQTMSTSAYRTYLSYIVKLNFELVVNRIFLSLLLGYTDIFEELQSDLHYQLNGCFSIYSSVVFLAVTLT